MAARRTRGEPDAVRITTAPQSHHDDIVRRRKRYLISMSVRTACFLGAIVIDGPVRWVLLIASFILPYVAVVMANAASPRIPGTDLVTPHAEHRELH